MVDRWNIRLTLRLRTLRSSISTNGSIEFVPWFFFIFHFSFFIFHFSFFIFHISFFIFHFSFFIIHFSFFIFHFSFFIFHFSFFIFHFSFRSFAQFFRYLHYFLENRNGRSNKREQEALLLLQRRLRAIFLMFQAQPRQ